MIARNEKIKLIHFYLGRVQEVKLYLNLKVKKAIIKL
jgi:hypothetical protein